MFIRHLTVICFVLSIALLPAVPSTGPATPVQPELVAQPQIALAYWVSMPHRTQHLFHVVLQVSGLTDPTINLALPAWTGLYQVRDFARFVSNLTVTDGQGQNLSVTMVDKQTWRVDLAGAATLRAVYDVYANTLSSFDSQVNDRHAFFNGATLFLYPSREPGRPLPGPVTLHLDPPQGWDIATGLWPTPDPHVFRADNYDHLVDCPVEMGPFQRYTFREKGVPFHIVVDTDPATYYDAEKLVQLVKTIVKTETNFMREVPFSHYTFIYHFPDFPAGGGMEHQNSTAITRQRRGAMVNIQALAGVTAHEFFHLWNVERITPASLMAYDYAQENYTEALYVSEGWTSYFTTLLLTRSGLRTKEDFYRAHAGQITTLQRRPGRQIQSVERSSWLTWFDKYPWYRRPEVSISYYNKGYLVALLLDLKIREVTDNRRSLDDVIRFMNWYFAHRGVGFNGTEEVLWVVNAVAQYDFTDFFNRYVRGTREIPWNDYLKLAGLELVPATQSIPAAGFVALRTRFRNCASPLLVDRVTQGSNAARAGLKPNDQIRGINGQPVSGTIEGTLRRFQVGQEITLNVIRANTELDIVFALEETTETTYSLVEMEEVTEKQRRIRDGWLMGKP